MAPAPWRGAPPQPPGDSRQKSNNTTPRGATRPDATLPSRSHEYWRAAATFRRVVLLGLVVSQTYVATHLMAQVLPYQGRRPLEIAILTLFAILFGWVSAGFWTAIAGFALVVAGRDRYSISGTAAPDAPLDPAVRTAIVMPICNEDVARVFAGLRATYESLVRAGILAPFDFFVLSDSTNPDVRVAEVDAWFDTCRDLDGFGHVFYRWRRHRIKRKSGNIGDFCRRWGKNYRYLVILDADSVMSGACLVQLVRLMEANPGAGIIQSAPHTVGRDTLHARIQQFASRVYGPLFTAGLHFWQLGESHYWGHNAIIRVAPFMRHCGLRRLPGHGLLSGEILSHDFVEAALIRRAGWSVWIAYDLPGSYEEMPPNLVDELQRDRRWCQGNLMNFRLSLLPGVRGAHRAVFVSGVMAYAAGLLWLAFLLLATALLAVHLLSIPQYFFTAHQLFPTWPQWHPEWALGLVGATLGLLYLPKVLGVIAVALRDPEGYGGTARLIASMLGESLMSALLAPIRMIVHTRFVLGALSGWGVQWRSPPRDNAETTWSEGIRRHGVQTLIGAGWAAGIYWLSPAFLWWLIPVLGSLIVSIPLSVLSSRVSLGTRLRAAGWFVVPEEVHPPREILTAISPRRADDRPPGFAEAIVNPALARLLCATGRVRARCAPAPALERERLVSAALALGPDEMGSLPRLRLLNDPVALSDLHRRVWNDAELHPAWRDARAALSPLPG
jgi:membrane glycosyltransferase